MTGGQVSNMLGPISLCNLGAVWTMGYASDIIAGASVPKSNCDTRIHVAMDVWEQRL